MIGSTQPSGGDLSYDVMSLCLVLVNYRCQPGPSRLSNPLSSSLSSFMSIKGSLTNLDNSSHSSSCFELMGGKSSKSGLGFNLYCSALALFVLGSVLISAQVLVFALGFMGGVRTGVEFLPFGDMACDLVGKIEDRRVSEARVRSK